MRTWPGLSGPKLSWPTRLAGSQDLERLTTLQSGAPSQPARAQAWTRRLQTQRTCHAPKGHSAAGEIRRDASPRRLCLRGELSPCLAAFLVSKGGGASSPLAVLWRGIGAGAQPPAAAESQCNRAWVACSGLVHPLPHCFLLNLVVHSPPTLLSYGFGGLHACPR